METNAEQRFDAVRRRIGMIAAPLVFAALWFAPTTIPSADGQRLLPVLGLMVTLWVTEAIPLPVTALLGPALCVVLGVAGPKEVLRNFADPIIFVFLGSFLIAEAMLTHGLNRRVAIRILGMKFVGSSPIRLLAAFGIITAVISMWISNTATTAMMFPIGLAILTEMAGLQSRRTGRPVSVRDLSYGTAMMLMTAFAASVGGLATPVGTPPNLIGLGIIREQLNIELPFFHWMLLGTPIAAVMVAALVVYLPKMCPPEEGLMTGTSEWIRNEQKKIGRLSAGERNVLIAFLVTVFLWMAPGAVAVVGGVDSPAYRWWNSHLPESVVAILGAVLLFLLPLDRSWSRFTLDWSSAARIDWGTILLFGGGLALGDLMFSTGLAKWMGEGITAHLGASSGLSLVILFTVVGTLVSETTSNAASATMVVPVAIAVAQAAGVDPLGPALAACLGSSLGFMLPVSTPPNAIVYGSGCVPLMKMVKCGLLLDLLGAAVIVVGITVLLPLVR